MARQGFFKKVFEGMSYAGMLVHNAWIDQLEREEKDEREAAQRLLDYYNRDRTKIVDHMKSAARKTFGNEINDWQWPIVNGIPRVIKRLSLAYIAAPERRVKRGDVVLDITSKEHELVFGENGLYSAIDIDRKMKEADRYSTLLNTCHIEVVPRRGRIDWDVRLRPGVIVVPDPDDYLQFVNFAYEFNLLDPETLRARNGWVYWTPEEHKYIMANGDEVGMSLDSGANPYGGEIPIVTVRKLVQDDYWGCFGADLIEAFEQANLQLANTWENGFMQTHGQPFGVNLGLKPGQTIITGCKNPITVEKVGKEDVPPSLSFVKPDADIEVVLRMVEWLIKNCGQCYGLPPSAWSLDEVPESGFAKFMNNIELFEDREDGQAMWIEVERELFRNSRMVWNRFNLGPQIPEDLELDVVFQPVSMPENPSEKMTRYTMGIKAGVSSPVRYFMDEENLTREQAIAKAKEIEEENDMFKGSSGATNDFLGEYLGGPGKKPPEKPEEKEEEEEE